MLDIDTITKAPLIPRAQGTHGNLQQKDETKSSVYHCNNVYLVPLGREVLRGIYCNAMGVVRSIPNDNHLKALRRASKLMSRQPTKAQ